jgi:bifunctional ADP-heptose synthase (sugar kinase/adenylyltransferase)
MAGSVSKVIGIAEALEWRARLKTGPVLASGGFSWLHVGHVRYLRAAGLLGPPLLVVVNGDGWLERKYGKKLAPAEERAEIVAALEGVSHVVVWDDGFSHVGAAIRAFRPSMFAKGGDRSTISRVAREEMRACADVNCELKLGVGGCDKPQSSSALMARAKS